MPFLQAGYTKREAVSSLKLRTQVILVAVSFDKNRHLPSQMELNTSLGSINPLGHSESFSSITSLTKKDDCFNASSEALTYNLPPSDTLTEISLEVFQLSHIERFRVPFACDYLIVSYYNQAGFITEQVLYHSKRYSCTK